MTLKEELRNFIKTSKGREDWLRTAGEGCSNDARASLENARSRYFLARAEALRALVDLERA